MGQGSEGQRGKQRIGLECRSIAHLVTGGKQVTTATDTGAFPA